MEIAKHWTRSFDTTFLAACPPAGSGGGPPAITIPKLTETLPAGRAVQPAVRRLVPEVRVVVSKPRQLRRRRPQTALRCHQRHVVQNAISPTGNRDCKTP